MRSRIHTRGRGVLFTPTQFLDLGKRAAVDKALSRLATAGEIRRLARGVYDYPKTHPKLGVLAPPAEDVARTLAGKHRIRLLPSGAYAANVLRLSDQVPAKMVFLTDGPSRKVRVGGWTIELRHTTPRNMAAADRTSGLLIAALRDLGQAPVTRRRVAHLRQLLSPAEFVKKTGLFF